MARFSDIFTSVSGVLAADVANAGTFTFAYPSGTTQQSFDTGLTGALSSIIIDYNDKWTVAAAKVSFAFGASLITVTNSSGVTWRAGQKYLIDLDQVDGNTAHIITLRIPLASIANGALLNPGLRPGIAGTLEYWEVMVDVPATTAAKLSTINPTIDGVDVTGGTIALTSANMTPFGVSLAGAPITGANTVTAASKIGFKAASTTAFVEGSIIVLLRIRSSMSSNY